MVTLLVAGSKGPGFKPPAACAHFHICFFGLLWFIDIQADLGLVDLNSHLARSFIFSRVITLCNL